MPENPEAVRREVLTYLARLPKTIQENGPEAIGEVAVQLGNCLLWIHDYFESGESHAETPLHETAQSIYALGKQLRQVGLYWWEKRNNSKTDRFDTIEKEIRALQIWIARVDETLSKNVHI
jgi:hypothetical protein